MVEGFDEVRWPTKGDEAFVPGTDRRTLVELDWFRALASDDAIATGFKAAADRVVESLTTSDTPRHPDQFFFPVAYLYRHYIELSLKYIIRGGQELGLVTIDSKELTGHNLHVLWNKARAVLEALWPKAPRDDLVPVEQVILEFHKMDRTGQEFRYARSRNGCRHLENAPKLVDLANMKDVMDRLSNFLEGCGYGVAAACDAHAAANG